MDIMVFLHCPMSKSTESKFIGVVLCVVSVVLLFGLLVWKYQLGITRYFDADELAYLHWAHNVFAGSRPYLDFFFYVPPGFLWFLAGIYAFFGGTTVLEVSRVLAFCIFVGMCVVSGLVLDHVRRRQGIWERIWIVLLPGIILSFLPLPADKMLEIRPDNLAVLLVLLGLLFQLNAMRVGGKKFWWVGAGLLYGLSLFVLPKTLPQVGVAFIVALFSDRKSFGPLLWGVILAFVPFGAWVFSQARTWADFDTVIYSLTTLPLEVNRIGEIFYMQPDLFFYPNATYYGLGGWSRGLIANHAVWLIGLMIGVWRLFTPFISSKDGKVGTWKEILVVGSLMAYVMTFMYGYPLRHAQYLIPIAVFVAIYAADGLVTLRNFLQKMKWGSAVWVIGYFVLCICIWHVSHEVNNPKFAWTNAEDKRILQTAIDTIPKDSYVFDLVGATLYFKDPYYICCLPFGQYTPYISRPFPSLSQSLAQSETGFVYEGRLRRVSNLTADDKSFISSRFVSSGFLDGLLILRKP